MKIQPIFRKGARFCFSAILFILPALYLTSCTSSQSLYSWSFPDDPARHYNKLAILFMTPKLTNRTVIEYAVFDEFRALKINAIPTFDIFPFAGQIDEIGQNMSKEELERRIQEKITQNKIDALLISSVLREDVERRYVPGTSVSISVPNVSYSPVYGMPYYNYYSYVNATVYDGGYYTSSSTYFIETNLYDIASGKLIYTAQSNVKDPDDLEKASKDMGKAIAEDLLEKKVIK